MQNSSTAVPAMEPQALLPLLTALLLLPLLASSANQPQVYIVYFGQHKGDKTVNEIEESHHSYLNSIKRSEAEARSSLIYSYKHSINGFAAVLTPDEASKLSALKEVVSVFPSHPKKHVMHTTRSWEFIGLGGQHWHIKKGEDVLSKARYGADVIVGLIDSGFWPESKSFHDEEIGPIPTRWKGVCQAGDKFNSTHCNKKVIGARYYIKGYEQYYGGLNRTLDFHSPRDADGHGSHTASIVAGREVKNASYLNRFARGTATGGAPLARLAIYKACWAVPGVEKAVGNTAVPGVEKAVGNTCFDTDMLAAIDDAIADGVDVLSISIGTSSPLPFEHDAIAIGSLHAVKRGVSVVCSAGNSGPTRGTLSNPAPWVLTVGASTIDRDFPAPLVLGNGERIVGKSYTTDNLERKMYPLVYAGHVEVANVSQNLSGLCTPNSLSAKAKGKIVLCLRGSGARISKGMEVKRAGGAGFILGNTPATAEDVPADEHVLPATAVGSIEALEILKYINSSENPRAMLVPPFTAIHTKPAPSMALFTSRGPNVIDPHTLKPDIAAPGVDILAAWSEVDPPSKMSNDTRVVEWNFDSGTSMACPHVAATAALLKSIHPHWSTAAIRSAIITSAGLKNNVGSMITDEKGNNADPFQFGAGHIRPTKAMDPGLVYDASYQDYLLYLCNFRLSFDPSFACPKSFPKLNDLNYPSIAVPGLNGTVTVKRTVTNVGQGRSVYFASVRPPMGYEVTVSPSILKFKRRGEKKSFRVTFKVQPKDEDDIRDMQEYAFGWLSWFDGFHNVRSPMAVYSA